MSIWTDSLSTCLFLFRKAHPVRHVWVEIIYGNCLLSNNNGNGECGVWKEFMVEKIKPNAIQSCVREWMMLALKPSYQKHAEKLACGVNSYCHVFANGLCFGSQVTRNMPWLPNTPFAKTWQYESSPHSSFSWLLFGNLAFKSHTINENMTVKFFRFNSYMTVLRTVSFSTINSFQTAHSPLPLSWLNKQFL